MDFCTCPPPLLWWCFVLTKSHPSTREEDLEEDLVCVCCRKRSWFVVESDLDFQKFKPDRAATIQTIITVNHALTSLSFSCLRSKDDSTMAARSTTCLLHIDHSQSKYIILYHNLIEWWNSDLTFCTILSWCVQRFAPRTRGRFDPTNVKHILRFDSGRSQTRISVRQIQLRYVPLHFVISQRIKNRTCWPTFYWNSALAAHR